MTRYAMFLRMIIRALMNRKARVAIALAALIIGTGVISGLLSVYYDINVKMSKELRSYGANFVLVPEQKDVISEDRVADVVQAVDPSKVVGYTPNLFGVVTLNERKVVLMGSWLDQISKVTPYWEITGAQDFSRDDEQALIIGYNVAQKLGLKVGDPITLTGEGDTLAFSIKGILRTGNSEDNQVLVNLGVAQKLLARDKQVSMAYFSLMGKSDELSQLAMATNKNLTGAELQAIKQISKSEGIILEKIKSLVYLVVLVILLSTLLCVSTTMMTMVIERRKEIGLRKALGAQNVSIVKEFLGEGVLLGLGGGLAGALLGLGLAQIIGQSVFHSYISLRFEVIVMVTFMSVLVAAIASVLPVRTAVGVEPALILKGE